MSRAPDFAPSWLPRQQRRHVDRALRKLFQRNACSFCGEGFKHNHPSAAGFDAHGNVAVAGECCMSRIAVVFGSGLYSDRNYDFLPSANTKPSTNTQPTNEQIVDAIAAYQKAIAETDQRLADVERRGGGGFVSGVYLLDHPWKDDDRAWFKLNPSRAHRVRMPFPNEIEQEAAAATALIVCVRQVEPGTRLRSVLDLDANLLPPPDDEATAHALFEAAVGREPMPRDSAALCTLVERYTAEGAS
jgi:hypothetical protein